MKTQNPRRRVPVSHDERVVNPEPRRIVREYAANLGLMPDGFGGFRPREGGK